MCEYCSSHGAGRKWYLQARNYMKNHEDDSKRKQFIEDFVAHFMDRYEYFLKNGQTKRMLDNDDPNWIMRQFYTWYFRNKHSGQVVPLEEAEMIMDLAQNISLVPCVCRMANAGVKEKLCMVFFAIPEDTWGHRHFQNKGDIEPLEIEEGKIKLREFAEQGLVQTVWTFNSPHIGAVCNCDYPVCTAVRFRRNSDVRQSLLKSEYLAKIDQNNCTNCRKCITKCQFGALTYTASMDRMHVNSHLCFGCGICRQACTKDAITLVPREENEIAANIW
jgi:ferredoxin